MACIYLLKHNSNKQTCKVGKTKNDPVGRAEDYADGNWSVFEQWETKELFLDLYEKEAHKILNKYKVPKDEHQPHNEMFTLTAEDALPLVQQSREIIKKKIIKDFIDQEELEKERLRRKEKIEKERLRQEKEKKEAERKEKQREQKLEQASSNPKVIQQTYDKSDDKKKEKKGCFDRVLFWSIVFIIIALIITQLD